MKKYKLIKSDSIELYDRTLYKVEALRDFGDVKKGDMGGWIEKESNLSHEGGCWVFGNARVFDNAKVFHNAKVIGNTLVYANARVGGNAIVFDEAWVYGNVLIYNNAKVGGNAMGYGSAHIAGNATVYDNAEVFGGARVFGDAICTKTPINITNLKLNITITDNHVQVGYRQWLKEDVNNVKYKEVKDEGVTLVEFRKIMETIKILLKHTTSGEK